LKLYAILSGWYVTESPFTFMNEENNDIIAMVCYNKNFIDISLYNQWDVKKIKSKGLSKKLDENHPFFRDPYRAYADYLYSSAAIMNKKIEFYSSIAYTILK
ncbi:301_t:CDS:2, partial [Funneliformis caledonium]